MASPRMALEKASTNIQTEHGELMQQISQLDTALDGLICYAEVYADLAAMQRVLQAGSWLDNWLPDHFLREEETLFVAAARLNPEVSGFVREMKHQHTDIGVRLQAFCKLMQQVETTSDIEQSVTALKQEGKQLTNFMAAHMGAEERRFGGLKG